MEKDKDLFNTSNSESDGDVIFRNVNGNPHTPINAKTGEVLVGKKNRIKVGEITNPIYDDMVLSNGRKVKDIVSRAVEMPLYGSVGAEHIERHKERQGMVGQYIGIMNDIINDPDYVFEDKMRENTIVIEKEIDKHTVMVISLNFDNPEYTNTVITMLGPSEKSFDKMVNSYVNSKKVLYKKEKA